MFRKLEEAVNFFVENFSMALLILMTMVVSWVVFSRYLLNSTPAWGEEGALLCMVWFGFVSMALGVRDNLHISIDIFDRILSDKVKYGSDWLKRILILAFAVFMVIEGLNMSEVAMGNDMPGIGIPSAILYAAVPVAGLAMIYYVVVDVVREIKKLKEAKQ